MPESERIERAARALAREFGEEVGWADWQRVARIALTADDKRAFDEEQT